MSSRGLASHATKKYPKSHARSVILRKMPKNDVACKLCGKLFFPHSLPIHLPQCQKKFDALEVPCQWCDVLFPQGEMAKHQRRCPQKPAQATVRPMDAEALLDPSSDGDHRIPCAVCGRKFSPDRIGKHQSICRKVNSKEQPTKKMVPKSKVIVKPPQNGRKLSSGNVKPFKNAQPFGTSSKARHELECPAPAQESNKTAPESLAPPPGAGKVEEEIPAQRTKQNKTARVKEPTKKEGATPWEKKSLATRALIKDARRMHQQQVAGVPLSEIKPSQASENAYAELISDFVPCPHCHRTFAPNTAARHIPKCANTINKPKAPPALRRR